MSSACNEMILDYCLLPIRLVDMFSWDHFVCFVTAEEKVRCIYFFNLPLR